MDEKTTQEEDDRFVLGFVDLPTTFLSVRVFGRYYRRNLQNTAWERDRARDRPNNAVPLAINGAAHRFHEIEELLRLRRKDRETDQRLRDLESEVGTLRGMVAPAAAPDYLRNLVEGLAASATKSYEDMVACIKSCAPEPLRVPPLPETAWVLVTSTGLVYTRLSGATPRRYAIGPAFFDTEEEAEMVRDALGIFEFRPQLVNRQTLEAA